MQYHTTREVNHQGGQERDPLSSAWHARGATPKLCRDSRGRSPRVLQGTPARPRLAKGERGQHLNLPGIVSRSSGRVDAHRGSRHSQPCNFSAKRVIFQMIRRNAESLAIAACVQIGKNLGRDHPRVNRRQATMRATSKSQARSSADPEPLFAEREKHWPTQLSRQAAGIRRP